MQVKQISDNEIYLLIKYKKSVLWRVGKRLSYIEDARHLKVNCIYGLRYRSYIGAAGSCTYVWPVPEAIDTVNVLLMMGVESTRNM